MQNKHKAKKQTKRNQPKRAPMRAIPVAITNPNSGTFRGTQRQTVSGSDIVHLYEQTGNEYHAAGELLYETQVTTHLTKRLRNVCKNYQRITWKSLSFIFEGSWSTMATGGFTAAFVNDPTDRVPANDSGFDKLTWLAARNNTRDSKWYGNSVLNIRPVQDKLWTSMDEEREPRLYSPGSLFVMSRGGPSQPGTLTIRLNWTVEVSVPSTEEVGETGGVHAELKVANMGRFKVLSDKYYKTDAVCPRLS